MVRYSRAIIVVAAVIVLGVIFKITNGSDGFKLKTTNTTTSTKQLNVLHYAAPATNRVSNA